MALQTGRRTVAVLLGVMIFGFVFSLGGVRPAAATHIPCPASLGAGNHVLDGNLGCNPGTGGAVVTLLAGAHLNLNGFTVSCGNGASGIGIRVTGTGVHINNGHVHGCGAGILLSLGGFHHLNGLHVDGNICCGAGGSGDGIVLILSNDNLINGNTVSFNQAIGVHLVSSSRNQLNTMIIRSNEGPPTCGGVAFFAHSNNNVISSSDISDNGDFGVFIDFTSNGNTVRSSTVVGTNFFGFPTPGIEVFGSGNTIRGNTASGNGVGILVFGTSNLIQSNTALANVFVDLDDVNPGCDGNTWKSNTFVTDLVAGVPDGGPGVGCIQ